MSLFDPTLCLGTLLCEYQHLIPIIQTVQAPVIVKHRATFKQFFGAQSFNRLIDVLKHLYSITIWQNITSSFTTKQFCTFPVYDIKQTFFYMVDIHRGKQIYRYFSC